MTYNGWRNRATWLVNVWYDPASVSDIDYIEDTLEDEFIMMLEEKFGTAAHIYADLMNFDQIDWDELRDAMKTEEELANE